MISVETSTGIRYEDYHPKCRCIYSVVGKRDVVFLQCFTKSGEIKRYWGECNRANEETLALSFKNVMSYGDKWPNLGQPEAEYEGSE